jgi:phosphate starvation-inducible PhoH-like protein
MPTRRRKKKYDRAEKVKPIVAKTENQKEYIRSIIENDITFCCGPAGSGKSFVVSGIAANHLNKGKTERIIVTRPLVCTGKDIGALPGDLNEKIAPYLTPMQENFKFFLGQSLYGHYNNEGKLRYEPLEIMRGATFHESYMILDEAQNCTFEQIKMFITRMGECSKVIINGDINQSDIKGLGGLERCMDRLEDVEGVGVCELDHGDIQRNGILGRVLDALED